jgi:hypothetical protein
MSQQHNEIIDKNPAPSNYVAETDIFAAPSISPYVTSTKKPKKATNIITAIKQEKESATATLTSNVTTPRPMSQQHNEIIDKNPAPSNYVAETDICFEQKYSATFNTTSTVQPTKPQKEVKPKKAATRTSKRRPQQISASRNFTTRPQMQLKNVTNLAPKNTTNTITAIKPQKASATAILTSNLTTPRPLFQQHNEIIDENQEPLNYETLTAVSSPAHESAIPITTIRPQKESATVISSLTIPQQMPQQQNKIIDENQEPLNYETLTAVSSPAHESMLYNTSIVQSKNSAIPITTIQPQKESATVISSLTIPQQMPQQQDKIIEDNLAPSNYETIPDDISTRDLLKNYIKFSMQWMAKIEQVTHINNEANRYKEAEVTKKPEFHLKTLKTIDAVTKMNAELGDKAKFDAAVNIKTIKLNNLDITENL